MPVTDELLRSAMRHWTSGVSIVTSRLDTEQRGLTANSLTSISLNPPLICVTLAARTRTHALTAQTGTFAVTILAATQADLAARFAGDIPEMGERFAGLETFTLETGCPLITGGMAWMDCRVAFMYPMKSATLFVGELTAAKAVEAGEPLVYHHRTFGRFSS